VDSLHLGNIRKALPKEVFEKSLPKSLYYMVKDYAIWGSAVALFAMLVKSSFWVGMPFVGKAAATFVYSQVCGFVMWW
jgi:fatty acid desaturase